MITVRDAYPGDDPAWVAAREARERDLGIPPRLPFVPRRGSELYGASYVAAAYCGIGESFPPPPGDWITSSRWPCSQAQVA